MLVNLFYEAPTALILKPEKYIAWEEATEKDLW